MKKVFAGIDIGGTKIAVALEDLSGEKIAVRRLPTRVDIGAFAVIETVFQAITEMLAENHAELIAVGIGCPSPLDIEKGLVMSPSNLRDWDNFPIVKLFKSVLKFPSRSIMTQTRRHSANFFTVLDAVTKISSMLQFQRASAAELF